MADKKYGRNKKWCEKYKQTGQRERNKSIKAERNQRRIAYFMKRREEGKAYEYQPNPFDPDGSRREKKKYYAERRARAEKNVDRRDSVSKWRSIMRKTQNIVDAEEEARKKAMEEKRKTFVRKPHKKKTIAEEANE